MRIDFNTYNKKDWGEKQHEVSKILCEFLACGNDFFVKFGQDKTPKQHRGYWRLIGIILPYLQEAYKGQISNSNDVSDFIKIECGYFKQVQTKTKTVVLAKSLKDATKDNMNEFIEKIYFICEFFKIKDYKLTSEEKRALNDYYK